MKYIKLYKNFLIKEELNIVDSDIDMIYDRFFKEDIDYIEEFGKLRYNCFPLYEIYTSILTDEKCKKAHSINPCIIKINNRLTNNSYNPIDKVIGFSINNNALNFAKEYPTLNDAKNDLVSEYEINGFLKEFTEEKIKGSIHHELGHWLDDTFNNQHIEKELNKKSKGVDFNSGSIEREGQMYNIYQLRKKNIDIWDNLTFDDVIEMSNTLSLVNRQLKGETNIEWRKNILKRMYREGLLGKNM
jgi:hypothetical protein